METGALIAWAEAKATLSGLALLVITTGTAWVLLRDEPTNTGDEVSTGFVCGNALDSYHRRQFPNARIDALNGRRNDAVRGERIFKAFCAACHKLDKDMSGPGLKYWFDHCPKPELQWARAFLTREDSLARAKHPYVLVLRRQWNVTNTGYFHREKLSEEELGHLLAYLIR